MTSLHWELDDLTYYEILYMNCFMLVLTFQGGFLLSSIPWNMFKSVSALLGIETLSDE